MSSHKHQLSIGLKLTLPHPMKIQDGFLEVCINVKKECIMNYLRGLGAWISKPLNYRTYRYSITMTIIVINIIIFIITTTLPQVHALLVMNPYRVIYGYHYWTFITYMFDHASLSHLFFNMLALFFFGTVVERTWGSNEFMLIYGLLGTLSGIFSLLVYLLIGNVNIVLLGASGAIYGIMLIYACLYPHQVIYVFGVFPLKAKILMLIFIGIELFSSITGPDTNIAHNTHLSGIGVAWLYLYFRQHINPYHRLLEK